MQIIGIGLLFAVLAYGFADRQLGEITAFDGRALIIVVVGSIAAIITSSSGRDSLRTLLCLREVFPFTGTLARGTRVLEQDRAEFTRLWREGSRAQAVELAERSASPVMQRLLALVVGRASEKTVDTVFLELRHAELSRWQPATYNWQLLAKLGPSMGMVGTITGMIQLFRGMGADNFSIGAAMSMALVSTLYGITFGMGMAGPVGHYLRTLLDERLGVVARCRQSAVELADAGPRRS